MSFRLIDKGWDKVLDNAVRADRSIVRIACPFIKESVAKRLLKYGRPKVLQIITRFNLCHFYDGVGDVSALHLLLKYGAKIRGVRNLHAKLYVFGSTSAIVTSANLTESGLTRNHEFGFEAEDQNIVERCHRYFDNLWNRAGQDLSAARLKVWKREIDRYAAEAPNAPGTTWRDEGMDLGFAPDLIASTASGQSENQAFVKFFGEGHNREKAWTPVLEVVKSSGCHWACTYPLGKRPRQVEDGAMMFMGRLVKEPSDTLIYGRAIGMHHEPGRDDATERDLKKRWWKKRWPHYVRVHHAEFISGNLSNGISLNELMDALGPDSFASTKRNAARREGNTDPRRAYRQKPSVELSAQGIAWLNGRLEGAFARHGRIPLSKLDKLDWPKLTSPFE